MGCGCWAQDEIAVTTSGVGEYLIKTMLAKECAQYLIKNCDGNRVNSMSEAFRTHFLGANITF